MTIQMMGFALSLYNFQSRFIGSRCCIRLPTHKMSTSSGTRLRVLKIGNAKCRGERNISWGTEKEIPCA